MSRKTGRRGATPAIRQLVRLGVAHRVHDCGDARSGQEVADHLGVDGARVLKTLVAATPESLVVAVIPVPAQLDLKALAAHTGAKTAALAEESDAERATGYVVGGISPIGQKRRLPTVVDAGALAASSVFVSGGRRGLEIELAPDDLIEVTDATVAPLVRT